MHRNKQRLRIGVGLAAALAVAAVAFLLPSRPGQAAATQFSLSPSTQTVTAGSSFTVTVELATGGANVDTTQVALSYPSGLLSCVTTANTSDFSVVPQADSCSGGNVLIQRGRTSGFNSDGAVATITFKALATGTAAVNFTDSTAAYSAGNLVTSATSAGSYAIAAPASNPAPASSGAPATSAPSSSSGSSSANHSKAATGTAAKPATASGSSSSSSTASSTTNTPAGAGTTAAAPVITNLQVVNVTDATATVTWNTDQPATSQVRFGLDQSYQLTATGTGLATAHSVTLSPSLLQPGLSYYVQASSANAAGASATSSTNFTTTGAAIVIHVASANGQSLAGATVVIDGKTGTTNSQGDVSFTNVKSGAQAVKISYAGSTTTKNVKVGTTAAGKTTAIQNFKLVASNANLVVRDVLVLVVLFLLLAAGAIWRYRVELRQLWARLNPQPAPIQPIATPTSNPIEAAAVEAPTVLPQPQIIQSQPQPVVPSPATTGDAQPPQPGMVFQPQSPEASATPEEPEQRL